MVTSMDLQRPYSQVLELLRAAGLRTTRQRLALAKLLFDGAGDRHVSAEMLHGEALKNRMRVSLATVYNTLHQFTDAGLLREIAVDSGRSYFDTNVKYHHHMYIENHKKLVDISAADIDIKSMPAVPEGMEISRVDVIIRVNKSN